jgi:hypothetical protein
VAGHEPPLSAFKVNADQGKTSKPCAWSACGSACLKAGRTAKALPDRTAMSDSAAMGLEFVVPAAHRPRGRDLIANAPG